MSKDKSAEVRSFFDQTGIYLHKDFGVKTRALIARDLLGKHMEGKRLIDTGCGNGAVGMQFLPSASAVHFLDLSENMLDLARQNVPESYKSKTEFFLTDLENFHPAQNYDIIIAFGLIMHVNDPKASFERMVSMLNPGGLLLIHYTNYRHPISKLNHLLGGEGRYNLNKIDKKLIQSLSAQLGLKVLKTFSYSLLLKGLGRLPDNLLYKFHTFTYRNRLISKMGMDDVFLLQKAPKG